jgi:ribosomal protein S17E
MAYTDTLLPPLLEQADKLIKQFRYEKNEQYEQHGRYVHRLLTTSSNTARNFIQAYVRDDRQTIVKSYYYGNSAVDQQRLVLQSDGEQQEFTGSNHHFQTEGHHEIMTLEDEQALALLNFISAHMQSKVRVEGIGNKAYKNWVYYLNDKEKEALSQTYQLGWLMKDIKRIEQMQQVASKQIMRYEQKKEVK